MMKSTLILLPSYHAVRLELPENIEVLLLQELFVEEGDTCFSDPACFTGVLEHHRAHPLDWFQQAVRHQGVRQYRQCCRKKIVG